MRAYFLTGFPWYYLAHSQYRSLYVIQIADFAGSLGISFLIAFVNAWLVDLVTLPLLRRRAGSPGGTSLTSGHLARLWSITILVGATLGYGSFRLTTAQFREGPRVALLQSNHKQGHKFQRDPDEVRTGFLQLIERAASREPRPDLIVWPETAYPFGYIMADEAVAPEVLETPGLSRSPPGPRSRSTPGSASGRPSRTTSMPCPRRFASRCWSVRGSTTTRKTGSSRTTRRSSSSRRSRPFAIYHKMHLVPFGEFIPYIEALPWLAALTPYRDKIPNLNFGRERRYCRWAAIGSPPRSASRIPSPR